MANDPVYVCHNPRANAFMAADEFSRDCHEYRQIEEWKENRFRFVDGAYWYRVEMTPRGWLIFRE
jgi:hypothetical protein